MRQRENSLDFLKICATIIIVFHHYQQVTGAVWTNHINFYGGSFYWGYVVELFFVISGFVSFHYIEKIQDGYDFKRFFLKRAKRLLPLVAVSAIVYEVALAVYFKLYGKDWFGSQINIFGIILDSFGLQNGWVFNDPIVNFPTWYISVLMLCYILFFGATYIAKKKEIPVIYLYVSIIFLGCGINTYAINLPFMTSLSARGYYSFFTGLILAMALNKYGISTKAVAVSVVNIITIVLIVIFRGEWLPEGLIYLITFVLYPSIIILFQSKYIKKLFSHQIWEVWGKISYDVYIWHNPMFLMMYILFRIAKWNPDLTKISSMYIYVLIVEIVGVVSYCFLEKPINKWMGNTGGGMQSASKVGIK